MKLKQAREMAEVIKGKLYPVCSRIEIAGSIRREKPEVGDIELVIIPDNKKLARYYETVNSIGTRVKGNALGKYTQRNVGGIDVDIFIVTPETWGLQLAIRTGSAEFSKNVLAVGWTRRGYHSEGGVLYPINMDPGAPDDALDYDNPVFIREEKDLFDFIGVPWKEPKERY